MPLCCTPACFFQLKQHQKMKIDKPLIKILIFILEAKSPESIFPSTSTLLLNSASFAAGDWSNSCRYTN